MTEPLFLQPIFKERIWGGTKLKEEFHYEIPSSQTGECWAISAHKNGQSVVENGLYEGISLDKVWEEHPELFGHYQSEVFPLLTKILDANRDLSVQVHPDDTYAQEHEGDHEFGKTECWYIIDCEPGAELIFGHHAQTRDELEHMIQSGKWDDLLRKVHINPGDFFYVPSGTIHALCEGTLVLETQQSSDTTYRVYDYDRVDAEGNTRDLHLDQAIEVTNVPHEDNELSFMEEQRTGAFITTLVESEFFSVFKYVLDGAGSFKQDSYFQLFSVIDGEATMTVGGETYKVHKGDHFILTSQIEEFTLDGDATIIVSHP
ncbi:mannose-6-phosphate isomerase, class I [Pontibacillus marinus]|uniref:Mannose-6-phosphate isomerase n=1 Tax=Pontibacillus marinus BH030004 = DSM 16465 TaxID=1385511 RepID=A0A0A5G2C6_9BACI|nr:mannose-6-phosphate isomerase, class I [Pontibacillus marinus]KGX85245.1 mannose-6-phosphate isomerase [Pontibacillus marinus BH030004 = DSM 16465]